ncbi:MAG: hypothetical protein GF408_06830 [Candidatus Omnitrophica bacterium]|nr:hypothetical protein [Candidatus Omnitrophota bacterium]
MNRRRLQRRKHRYGIKIIPIALVSICAVFLSVRDALPSERKIIVVIRSRPLEEYDTAYRGFREGMKKNRREVIYIDYDLERYKIFREDELASKVSKIKADIVCPIGTEAAEFVSERITGAPVVFFMVLDPEGAGIIKAEGSEDITGVTLDLPALIQFTHIKNILPDVKTVGMIYDARKKEDLAREAAAAASETGLELIARPAHTSSDITLALEELFLSAECLWAGIDTFVYNSTSGKHIILLTLKQQMPFIAFSSNFVKAGALLAFECDYYDIGVQASGLANNVLRGRAAGSLPVERPRKARILYNERTAEVIRARVNQDALRRAQVFGKKEGE